MLIDIHAHVNFAAFKEDSDAVIKKSLENEVWMINVGSQYSTSRRAVRLVEKFEKGVYAAIGIHPIHLDSGLVKIKKDEEETEFETRGEDFNYEEYKNLAKSPKVVAIGEIGLDYYYRPKTKIKLGLFKDRQKEVLLNQLNFARELDLPVILHCRMAHDDLIEILNNFQNSNRYAPANSLPLRGVAHCFTGTWEQAKKYMEMGFYLGFNGLIFKLDSDEIIKKAPLEKILIETDCPYLTPVPFVGQRNEPIHLKYIVHKISELKGVNYANVASTTFQSARNLFRI